MNLRRSRLAHATLLLLAAAVPCAQSQTAQPIPLYSPKPKPPAKPSQITLEPPKTVDKTQEPTVIESAPPPKPRPGGPPHPKQITADTPAPEAPVKSFAPEPVYDKALEQQISALAAASHTRLALYAWQLNTAKAINLNADQPVQTTNVIQLALFWETLRQVALGNTRWDEALTTTSLRDATSRMLLIGDTTIPPLLINRFTLKRVDADLTTLGYGGQGLQPLNRAATPRQMVRLLQHIAMCDLDLPRQLHINTARADATCQMATSMLRDHLYFDTMPSTPPQTTLLATKTGPIVVAAFTLDGTPTSLNTILQAILTAWSPQGLDTTLLGKPHLGVSWE